MRKNISDVIKAFRAGKRKGKLGASCSTDGNAIFSYRLRIAERLDSGLMWVAEDRSSTATTNGMISACRESFRAELGCTHSDCAEYAELFAHCNGLAS